MWRRQWQPTPVLLPGKSHGRRSLGDCSPWGLEAPDTTEWLQFHFLLSCIGEGNGNPLQCSCLENPKDGGSWCAAVYGVTQSQARLKQLSSSSSATMKPLIALAFPCLVPLSTGWTDISLVCIVQTLTSSTLSTEPWICLSQAKFFIGQRDGRFPFFCTFLFSAILIEVIFLPSALSSSILLQICNQEFSVQEVDLGPIGSELSF